MRRKRRGNGSCCTSEKQELNINLMGCDKRSYAGSYFVGDMKRSRVVVKGHVLIGIR